MQQCFLCAATFNGKTKAKLVNHVRDIHTISFEEYIIQSEYSGIMPKCACGLCDKRPFFRRGQFSKYALGHEKFKIQEMLHISKYGLPKCLCCGDNVEFYRGQPRQFCSHVCAGKHSGGFTQQETQEKIKAVVVRKYGVDNISKLQEVKDKISVKQTGVNNSFYGQKHSSDTLKMISNSSIILWQDPEFRAKVIPQFSALRKRNWQDPIYRKTILQGNLSGKNSKLHKNISAYLKLAELGFESEKVVFHYRVDEVNFENKIIVEINGDYVHANPTKFKPDDLIIVRSSQYLAKDKWLYDQKRKESLEALGFKIFVIWQSDNLEQKKKELYQFLGI